MSPKDTFRPLNIFYLVDATKTSNKSIPYFENRVREYKDHYEQGSLITSRTITLPLYQEAEQPLPYRCDLGFGFNQVLNSLSGDSDSQTEVFVFLQILPGGDWLAPLSELALQPGVCIHVVWIKSSDPKLSPEDLSRLSENKVEVRPFPDYAQFLIYLSRAMENRTGKEGWTPRVSEESQPGSGQAAVQSQEAEVQSAGIAPTPSAIVPSMHPQGAIQPALPADGKDTRSLQIQVPQKLPGQSAASDLIPQPKATIHLSQPITEPTSRAKEADEALVAPQPAAPITTPPTEGINPVVQESQPAETPVPSATAEETKDELPVEGGEAAQQKVEVEAVARQPAEPEKPIETPVIKPEPEPPVGKDGVASNWKNLEPPAELEDRVEHTDTRLLKAGKNWLIAAASRRGKMHAHQGIFREDAFGLGYEDGWNFIIVADGGGSRSLARVGSKLAAEVGIKAMIEEARNQAKSSSSMDSICRYILIQGIQQAYDAIRKEAQNREKKVDDFGTTYLAVAHHPMVKQHLLGTLQVGDGLISAMFPDRPPMVLADPDVGESASQTLFLTSKPWTEWISRIKVYNLEFEPALVVCMCDGVSDDLIPYKTNLPNLFAVLSDLVRHEAPEKELLEFLGYDKRGSFDDRTLAVIYPRNTSLIKASLAVKHQIVLQPEQFSGEEKS